jgi:hypothetical protein
MILNRFLPEEIYRLEKSAAFLKHRDKCARLRPDHIAYSLNYLRNIIRRSKKNAINSNPKYL